MQYPQVSTKLKMILPSFKASLASSPEQFLQRVVGVLNAALKPTERTKSPHYNYSQQRKIVELTPHYQNIDSDAPMTQNSVSECKRLSSARCYRNGSEQENLTQDSQLLSSKPRRQFRKSVSFEKSLTPMQQKSIIMPTYNRPDDPETRMQV